MDAQFTATNAFSFLGLFSCIKRARSSFPVPLSPDKRTVASLEAATIAIDTSFCILAPLASMVLPLASNAALSLILNAFSTVSSRASSLKGFSMKSTAPSFTASTAFWMVPKAVIRSTGRRGLAFLTSLNSSMPPILGMLISLITIPNSPEESSSRASMPFSASTGS